ncbi:MAG: AAA family ATPase [Oscillospiraceae bacterium]
MLIPIWGASGVGKTSTAIAISKIATAGGKSVLLISPEPYSELSAIFDVKIPQEQSLQAAIRSGNLNKSVFKKDELFYILAAAGHNDCFDDNYSAEQIKVLLELAKSGFDTVLVDCPTEMNNPVAAWAMSLADKILLCVGGEFQGALWYKSAERAISAIRHKSLFLGMEILDAFDYEALYNFLEQKPHYRIPNKRAKTYDKALLKLLEVTEN